MPVIGYNLNIPFATNNPSTDQPNMLTNTNAINTLIDKDHFTFSSSKAGRHKQVSLTNENAPGLLDGSTGVLYANASPGTSQPFWQNALGSFQIATMGASSLVTPGYINIGGILIQWGKNALSSSGTVTTITYPIPFPTAVFTITLGLFNTANNSPSVNCAFIKDGTVTLTNFKMTNSSSGTLDNTYWLAIGN